MKKDKIKSVISDLVTSGNWKVIQEVMSNELNIMKDKIINGEFKTKPYTQERLIEQESMRVAIKEIERIFQIVELISINPVISDEQLDATRI